MRRMSEAKKLALAVLVGALLDRYAPEVVDTTKEMAVFTAKAVLFPIKEAIRCLEKL